MTDRQGDIVWAFVGLAVGAAVTFGLWRWFGEAAFQGLEDTADDPVGDRLPHFLMLSVVIAPVGSAVIHLGNVLTEKPKPEPEPEGE